MSVTYWDDLEVLFAQARSMSPERRQAFLEEACGTHPELRTELEALLAHQEHACAFFDSLAEAVLPSALHAMHHENHTSPADPFGLCGQTVSHYRVTEGLGGGGMGFVYKAQDTKLDRAVALKFLPPHLSASEEAKRRFMQEAQAASALDHPNICTIHEIAETERGEGFIAMACYEGETLKHKIEQGALPLDDAADYAIQIAQGLSKAHAHGIVHRDIKPANVIITVEGVAKIIDFGLAKLMHQTQITKPGTTMGTIAYMSPEQVHGETVDHRTDIWSFGVVLYEMLTGQRPFRGEYEQAVRYAILNEPPPPITALRPDAEALAPVVEACLEKDPAHRYQTVAALLSDLRSLRHDDRGASHVASLRRQRRRSFSIQRVAAVVGVMLLVLLAGTLAIGRQTVEQWLGTKPTSQEIYLAVLPFTNMGDEPEDRAFTDGLAMTVADLLGQMSQVTGTPITVAPFGETMSLSAEEVAREKGVKWVVSGMVLPQPGQLRLTLNLIDPETPGASRSEAVVVARTEEASLQARMGEALARLLSIDLSAEERYVLSRLTTRNSQAYRFYLEGRAYLQDVTDVEDIDTSIRSFQWALEEDSLFVLAYAGLCAAYQAKYDLTQNTDLVSAAQQNCERAAASDERLPTVYATLGLLYNGTGAHEQAVREFKTALLLDSSNAVAYFGLANAYKALGRRQEAELNYRKAMKQQPNNWTTYNNLGSLYLTEARYEEAAAQFEQVLNLDPDNLWGYNNLGAAHLYMGQYEEAKALFEQAISRKPNDFAYANLGIIYYLEDRYAEEAQMYEKALAIDSSDYRVWGNLAGAYERLDEQDKAQATYERAAAMAEAQREVNPQDADVWELLAIYYLGLDQPSKATTYIEQALHLAPTNVELMVQAGRVYEDLGERETALEWINKALANGYAFELIETDPDLDALRADPRFNYPLASSN